MSDYTIARRRMVERQIEARGVSDPRVLEAMRKVPRHKFVDPGLVEQAYSDYPLPIGERQTISQPYIVAVMTEALQLQGDEKVLEVGTGSGYQAAVLSVLAEEVYSLERIPELARRARQILNQNGYFKVHVRLTDGTYGWEDEAPFDAILVTAGAPPDIPDTYLRQLAIGGRLVIPVGERSSQVLKRVTKIADDDYRSEDLLDCRFVPLVGDKGWKTA